MIDVVFVFELMYGKCVVSWCHPPLVKVVFGNRKSLSRVIQVAMNLHNESIFGEWSWGWVLPSVVLTVVMISKYIRVPPVCMFDKFHLTFNSKSKVSRDVFKNGNWIVNWHLHFSLECHLNVTCLIVCVISTSKVSVDMWVFSSQVTLHVSIDIQLIFVQMSKTLSKIHVEAPITNHFRDIAPNTEKYKVVQIFPNVGK